jgi:hypothetical protein
MNNYIWTTAVGAWGDTLCAYGNICKLLKERNEEKANIVFFGLDQNVCEFLKVQDKIAKVEWLKCEPPFVIGKYIKMAYDDPEGWHKFTGVKDAIPEIHFTHLHNQEPYRDFDCALPSSGADWKQFLADKEPYTLFQPYSTQSCDYADHWPHWKEALKFIVDNTDSNVVIVGEMPEKLEEVFDVDLFEHPQVTCLLGQTKSMIDVLHIASGADMVVTTCNAIAYWSIIKKKPSMVCCNKIIKDATPYYYKWLNHRNNFFDYESKMDDRWQTHYYFMKQILDDERAILNLSSVSGQIESKPCSVEVA